MSNSQSRLQKLDAEREDRLFASKRWAFLLYAPCVIPLVAGFYSIAMGLEASNYIIMASMLSLVSGALDMFRRKVIRQDKAIKQLQEQLKEAKSKDQ